MPSSSASRRRSARHPSGRSWPLVFIVGLVIVPAVLLGGAGVVTRALAGARESLRATMVRYAYALVPIGFGIWLAHYGFHLLTGLLTVVPVVQSAAVDAFGRALLGGPAWGWVGLQPGSVFPIQLGCVVLGAAGSMALVHAISLRDQPSQAALSSVPWLAVVAADRHERALDPVAADGDAGGELPRMTRLRRFAASARQGRRGEGSVRGSAAQALAHAHSGPPFPIVTDAVARPYTISIWTDPDATDDGSAGGQFWIVIGPSTKGVALAVRHRASVSVPRCRGDPASPSGRGGGAVRGDVTNQFGAVVMDHEGPYSVRVEVTGPLGRGRR